MSEEYSFAITDTPPEGKTRGRGPSPFVQPLKESYAKDFSGTGEWFEFYVDPAEVEKTVQRIRTAGQSAKVGTEVRQDEATGRIAFRGVEYVPRERKPAASATETSSAEDVATDDHDEEASEVDGTDTDHGHDVPVNPAGEPFEWDDQE